MHRRWTCASHAVTLRHVHNDLTPKQQLALAALLTGATDAVAAERAGVARETVTRWKHGHPAFAAELSRRGAEVTNGVVRELRDLAPLALDAVRACLTSAPAGVRLRAAELVLAAKPASHSIGAFEPDAELPLGVRLGLLLDGLSNDELDEVAANGRLPDRLRGVPGPD